MIVKEQLVDGAKSMLDHVSKSKLTLMRTPTAHSVSKIKLEIKKLNMDRELFARLFISCQTHHGDFNIFFKYENQAYPPSLADVTGENRDVSKMKAQLIPILEKLSSNVTCVPSPNVTVRILDGLYIVHILVPDVSKTFGDYGQNVFGKYVKSTLDKAQRVDIVFDVYNDDCLKQTTRERRGTGQRREVLPSVALPANW